MDGDTCNVGYVEIGPGVPTGYTGEDGAELLECEILPGVANHHCKSCGVPPRLDPSRGPIGHFENEHGEQGLMQFDMEEGVCRVWMGDCCWENEIRAEELNGFIIVRYLETGDEGRPDQLDRLDGLLGRTTAEEERRVREERFQAKYRELCERRFGGLTDEDFERASCMFAIRPEEYEPIVKFYETHEKAYQRLLRKKEKEEEKRRKTEQREADAAERKRLREERRAEDERMRAEAREERRRRIEAEVEEQEHRREIGEIKGQIKEAKRLISGEGETEKSTQP